MEKESKVILAHFRQLFATFKWIRVKYGWENATVFRSGGLSPLSFQAKYFAADICGSTSRTDNMCPTILWQEG